MNDSRLRWLGPVGLFLLGNVFFRLGFWLEATGRDMLHSVIVGLVAGALFWQLNRWIVLRLQDQLPGLERTPNRLMILLLLTPMLVSAAIFSRFAMHVFLGSREQLWLGLVDYVTSSGIQLFYHMVYFAVYEGWYLLLQWKQTYLEKEELLKAQWQSRFNALKSQVNPHFLFNSLNALSALIQESPNRASVFVDELSTVYRYLLQANDQELVPLSTELTFIDSYVHLLQTRYGKGVIVHKSVSPDQLNRCLPPLTLQMLLENAVKHNIVMASQPLCLEIRTTEEGQLMVRNNLQRKNASKVSNGVGLSNINAKYRMLTQHNILVQEDDTYFTVLLPLLGDLPARTGQFAVKQSER
ncbi:sensor histidine kinase [Nibrella saemangeumensis]